MHTFWKRFFWGAPSHKSSAWAGALSGLGLIAFALFMLAIGHGTPLFIEPSVRPRPSGLGI